MDSSADRSSHRISLPASLWRRLAELSESQKLLAILAVAVAIRALVAILLGDSVTALPGIYDQISYDMLARQLVAGRGFTLPDDWWPATRAGQPTAHWSYLYTSYLAGVYWLTGGHALAARLLQGIVVGALQPWLAFRVARRVFDRRAGLAAAAVTAVYAYFVYYSGALMTESFFILTVLWSLDVATRMALPAKEPPAAPLRLWLELGLALGAGILLRQLLLLLVPFLLLWLYAGTNAGGVRGERRSLQGMVVSLVVIAVMILPWTIRNYRAFDRFALLNTNAGYVLFWGNHPIHGRRFIPILPAGGPTYRDLIPDELRGLDEAALDRALLGRGIRFIVDDPGRYLALSMSRAEEYFKFWWSADSGTLSNLARVLSFGFFLPFMILGIALSTTRAGPGVALLLGFVVLYTLLHLMTWTLVRYRLPVDAVLVLFAAVGLVWAFDSLSARLKIH